MFLFSKHNFFAPVALVIASFASLAVVSNAALAQVESTVTIDKVTKKTIGTVTALNAGDIACYITLKDDQGVAFKEMADFDICEQKQSVLGKRLQLNYTQTSVMSDACQGDPDCKKTKKVILITKVKVLDAKALGANGATQGAQAATTRASDKQSSFCTPMEQVVFSCRTGAKLVSVCASKDASRTKGYTQYRFGKPDSTEPLEMILPEAQILPSKAATGDNVPYAGGGASWLRFSKGAYSYTVYSGIGRWGPKGEIQEKSGLLVERSGKQIANLKCSSQAASELGPDFFEKLKIQGNGQEFDMPD
jgi:hypothetical protein